MRIDLFLYEQNIYSSRNKAKEAIERGEVLYKGKKCKCSLDVDNLDDINILHENITFVSNGGYKLNKALLDFNLSVENLVALDIGASTGGFTDCLLKNNVKKVYDVDVGENQLDNSLKDDNRIVVMDNTNARNLTKESINDNVNCIVCDVSFISQEYILEPIYNILCNDGFAITLLKPQFECGKQALNKNGIVVDKSNHLKAAMKIKQFANNIGLKVCDFTNAPIKDGKNIEYLFLFKKGNFKEIDVSYIKNIIDKGR